MVNGKQEHAVTQTRTGQGWVRMLSFYAVITSVAPVMGLARTPPEVRRFEGALGEGRLNILSRTPSASWTGLRSRPTTDDHAASPRAKLVEYVWDDNSNIISKGCRHHQEDRTARSDECQESILISNEDCLLLVSRPQCISPILDFGNDILIMTLPPNEVMSCSIMSSLTLHFSRLQL